jgi:hypothetical protein
MPRTLACAESYQMRRYGPGGSDKIMLRPLLKGREKTEELREGTSTFGRCSQGWLELHLEVGDHVNCTWESTSFSMQVPYMLARLLEFVPLQSFRQHLLNALFSGTSLTDVPTPESRLLCLPIPPWQNKYSYNSFRLIHC